MNRPWRLICAALAVCLAGCATTSLDRRWVLSGPDDSCRVQGSFASAAQANAETLDALGWSPFGAPEQGWRIYAPRTAAEIGTRCAPQSTGFAARLHRWQAKQGLPADGRMSPTVFTALKTLWQARRPFVAVRQRGICPAPPEPEMLSPVAETYGGKAVLLRRDTARALTRMRAAALRDLAGLEPDPQLLTAFSGYRSPEYDAERCEREQNCQGVVRAQCSAHRTGTAVDLMVGAAPGFTVDSSEAQNRLFQSQTPAYRWLVAHAGQYGFVNYAFEPWHWEWTGVSGPSPH